MIASEQSVIAQVHNDNSYLEGAAAAAIDPGTGVKVYKDADGNWQVRQVGADSKTKRVAREQRNPPRGGMTVSDTGTSPLDQSYAADDNLETVGFHRYDRARLRKSPNCSADPTDAEAAWDENGLVVDAGGTVDGTNAPSEFVGRIVEEITRTGEDDLLIVEFY
jgi:hypothetical protein